MGFQVCNISILHRMIIPHIIFANDVRSLQFYPELLLRPAVVPLPLLYPRSPQQTEKNSSSFFLELQNWKKSLNEIQNIQ